MSWRGSSGWTGYDVFFLTGTDEHGQKVEQAAHDAGIDPQTYVDRISADFQDMARAMGVSNDDWIHTTEERHMTSCAELWRRIAASGDIYLDDYEGWYAVRDEAFYDESELTTRPDGTKVAPVGAPVEWVKEPSYFFRLSAWQDRLLKFYEDNPDFHRADLAAGTKSSASCAAGCTTCRSAAPRSAGACRCRMRRAT